VIKPALNESVSSWVFRVHLLNGISDFSNIISQNGKWTPFPRILNGTLDIYLPIDELEIRRLLRGIGMSSPDTKVFSDPVDYTYYLRWFYGDEKFAWGCRKIGGVMTYCLECIRSSIRINGFGFFNVNWLTSPYCEKHDCSLSILSAMSRKDAVIDCKTILMGEHPASSKLLDPSVLIDHKNKLDGLRLYFDRVTDWVAPCLRFPIAKFVHSNECLFPEQFAKKMGVNRFIGLKNYSSPDFLVSDWLLGAIYTSLEETQCEVFKGFMRKESEFVFVAGGVISKYSIIEILYKYREASCNECESFDCPANHGTLNTKLVEGSSTETEKLEVVPEFCDA
tara:strand:+ start:19861 stop:20871 length:1011 start_codon:yes stop_codon:yes gene_type:complete